MSIDQMETGKDWVTDRLTTFAREAGLGVTPIDWRASTERGSSKHLLAVSVDGVRRVLEFTDADLEDLPADDSVQSAIENHLRMFVIGEQDS